MDALRFQGSVEGRVKNWYKVFSPHEAALGAIFEGLLCFTTSKNIQVRFVKIWEYIYDHLFVFPRWFKLLRVWRTFDNHARIPKFYPRQDMFVSVCLVRTVSLMLLISIAYVLIPNKDYLFIWAKNNMCLLFSKHKVL